MLRLKAMGFGDYLAFLEANPGLPYDDMACLLSEGGDVAPVQLERLHAASVTGADRSAAVLDSLARLLRAALKRGWGVGKYWESDLMGALASWHVTWGGGEELSRLQKALLHHHPPVGWVPEHKGDPLLTRVASLARE